MNRTRTGPTDGELWRRLQQADEQAFAELFGRHCDAVYTYAFRRTASWSVAEDVTQATFAALWRRARQNRVDALRNDSARPVLLAMARGECGNATRSDRRRTALVDRAAADADIRSSEDDVDRWIEAEATMGEIRRLVGALPRSQRDVLELVGWAELSLTEAATVLGIPVGTVKSRMSRARSRLLAAGGASLLHDSDRRL